MSFICPTSIQSRSLWLGEIENWMNEEFISKGFYHYGYIVKSVKIIRDKNTKTAAGYGFIEFETPEIAKEVLNVLNGKLIPETKKTYKLNSATYSAGKVASMGNFPSDLDTQVTEEKLKDFFALKYKSVISSKVVIDPITKISKGYGFVKFSDHNESLVAIEEMNGKYLLSRPIKTNQASFKKLNEINSFNVNNVEKGDLPLNPITLNNLNDFYIQPATDNNGNNNVFNLSNFYINHGKYFSGNNSMNQFNNININQTINQNTMNTMNIGNITINPNSANVNVNVNPNVNMNNLANLNNMTNLNSLNNLSSINNINNINSLNGINNLNNINNLNGMNNLNNMNGLINNTMNMNINNLLINNNMLINNNANSNNLNTNFIL